MPWPCDDWRYHLLPGQSWLHQPRRLSHLLHSQCPRKTLLPPDGQFHHQVGAEWRKTSTLLRAQGLPAIQPHQRGIRTDHRTIRKLKACGAIERLPLRSALGKHLELKEELSVSGSGFTACRRHRDDTTIRGQLKHCVPIFSTEQFELIWGQAQISRNPQLREILMQVGRDQLVLIKRNRVQICTRPPTG